MVLESPKIQKKGKLQSSKDVTKHASKKQDHGHGHGQGKAHKPLHVHEEDEDHDSECAGKIAADALHENIELASNIEKLLHPNKDKQEKERIN